MVFFGTFQHFFSFFGLYNNTFLPFTLKKIIGLYLNKILITKSITNGKVFASLTDHLHYKILSNEEV